MATMRQIRSRIRVAKNIQQITKAMKMVAAARLKRAQDRVGAARPYADKMQDVMSSLAGAAAGAVEHPLLATREVKVTGVLLITGERGLCGSYNTAIIRRTLELIEPLDQASVRLYTIGRKGTQFFQKRGWQIADTFTVNTNALAVSDATSVARRLMDAYTTGEVDEIHIAYTRFRTAITQIPTIVKLLPVESPDKASGGADEDYIFEPAAAPLLGELLPRYVVTQVYRALVESVASEHGSRMTSMSSATDNAGKMISTLTLSLNRARQAGITKEISEIVGGAEALKG
jgi:F-type H+-transporting ATPase subunit gamma